ncbi:MAG: hypothetical protein KDC44_07395, partial [Phaeodactylibacter sp.]|nr:hypothetical protein [Phaeodactylibacter sp.]
SWGDGSAFRQEVEFEYALEGMIVLAHSKGFTNAAQNAYGPRNHGIRKYDPDTGEIRFWEFDIYGGVTEGTVIAKDRSILYQYDYGGDQLTDMWEYLNDSTYQFKVGFYEDGKWTQVFLQTEFQQVSEKERYERLKQRLSGTWRAKAWNGQLEEYWGQDISGHIAQSATYTEGDIVRYRAENKIEWVSGELILFTVIKGSNPKIFKATSFTDQEIVFENSDYSNPNKVVYHFGADGTFQRTISGVENGEPTTYTFEFKRSHH